MPCLGALLHAVTPRVLHRGHVLSHGWLMGAVSERAAGTGHLGASASVFSGKYSMGDPHCML
jgi:hypothetical protein